MDVICTSCGEHVSLQDFLGTVQTPYCLHCWNEQWKGREEEFVFFLMKQSKLDTIATSIENRVIISH